MSVTAERDCQSCGTQMHSEAHFCRSCGARQHTAGADEDHARPIRPPTPLPTRHPSRRRRRRYVLAAVLALVATAGAALALVLLPSDEPGLDSRLVQITAPASAMVTQLGRNASLANPDDKASMVTLRGTAQRAVVALDTAQAALRSLATDDAQDQRRIADVRDGLQATAALAQALSRSTLESSELRRLADAASSSRTAFSARVVTPLEVNALVDLLGEAETEARELVRRRAAARAKKLRSRERAAQAALAVQPAFASHTGFGYQAQLPTGDGWSQPADSEPTAGLLYRTNLRGPDGTFVIIDHTPYEAATFGGDYQSRRELGHTAFGAATEYVFQGGSLPECQRSDCVDYIMQDGSTGAGFAVLAGGPNFRLAQQIAHTVMESLTPN